MASPDTSEELINAAGRIVDQFDFVEIDPKTNAASLNGLQLRRKESPSGDGGKLTEVTRDNGEGMATILSIANKPQQTTEVRVYQVKGFNQAEVKGEKRNKVIADFTQKTTVASSQRMRG